MPVLQPATNHVIQVNHGKHSINETQVNGTAYILLSVSKNNCLSAAQNRCAVNREPAHIHYMWRLMHVACDSTKINGLVTPVFTAQNTIIRGI